MMIRSSNLDKQSILLIAIYTSFGFANLLSGTFIPVYLWKASLSYTTIGLYALSQYVSGGFTFYIAGKWVKEGNKLNCLRAGCLLSGIFYCIVLWLGDQSSHYVLYLGLVNGIGLGLFWLSYNIVYFEITNAENRDRLNGFQGLTISLCGMLAPWISSLFIKNLGHKVGYRTIFTASLIIFAICGFLSFFIAKRDKSGTYQWDFPMRIFRSKDKIWRRVYWAVAAQGVREGVFMSLLALVVYIATKEEAKVGTYTLTVSSVALFSNWLAGKWLKESNRKWFMLIAVILMSTATVVLFGGITFTKLMIFGVLTALFHPLFIIPLTSKVFDLIGRDEQSVNLREEYVIFREFALTSGRLFGLVPFFIFSIWLSTSEQALVWILLLVGSFPILSWIFIKSFFTLKNE